MGRTRWGAAPGPVGGRGDGEWGARNHPLDGLPRLPSAEVPDAIQAGEQLEAAGLAAMLSAAGDVELAWQQVADLLTVPELLGVLASQLGGAALKGAVPQAVASGRQQLLETLERQAQLSLAARQHLESALLAATGVLLRLGTAAVCTMQRVLRLFFLNESHTLSQVVWRRGVAVCTRRLYARHGTQTVCAHGLPPPTPSRLLPSVPSSRFGRGSVSRLSGPPHVQRIQVGGGKGGGRDINARLWGMQPAPPSSLAAALQGAPAAAGL